MPLEDLVGPNKFLDALNRNWPLDGDTASEGNDHISGHKNVVLNTFPGADGNGLDGPVHVERAALFVDNGNGTDRQGALEMAVGSSAQRPADGALTKGDTRWNVTTDRLETWDGSAWIELHAMAAKTSMFRAKQSLEADVAALAHVSSDEAVAYTRMLGNILDASAGSEEGALIFEAITSGALAEALRVIGAGVSSPRYHVRRSGSDIAQRSDDILFSGSVSAAGQAWGEITWDNGENYREVEVTIVNTRPTVDAYLIAQFRSGSWLTGALYNFGIIGQFHNGVAGCASSGVNSSHIQFSPNSNPQGTSGANPSTMSFTFQRPSLNRRNQAQLAYGIAAPSGVGQSGHGWGWYNSDAAIDGVRVGYISPNSTIQFDLDVDVIGRR